jgi:hypothetical protein
MPAYTPKYYILYDPLTYDLRGVLKVDDPALIPGLDPKFSVVETEDQEVVKYFPLWSPPSEYVWDAQRGIVLPKPKFRLTPDKTTCPGNGVDYYTIKVELFDYLGDPVAWDRVKIKDENEKAVTNVEELAYGQDNSTFKVKASSRCTAKIRVKEVNDLSVVDVKGAAIYKFAKQFITLEFTNPGF